MRTFGRPWKIATITMIVLLGAAATIYGGIVRPRVLSARQVYNHACCQGVVAYLRQCFETTGRYPATLRGCAANGQTGGGLPLDGWGHQFLYRSDGKTFVLVSYGRHGHPDGRDTLAVKGSGNSPPGSSICGNYDADEVVSDTGWQRFCGK